MMMSDLPRDVAEEVLSRLPVKSMRAVRCACKKWNTLSKSPSFRKRHLAEIKAASESMTMVVMIIESRLYLSSIKMHNKGLEASINHQGKLFNLTDEKVEINKVCHCDGLLLCVILVESTWRMVVWNPYLGQTRWFQPSYVPGTYNRYALGYGYDDHNNKIYKILRCYESSPDHLRSGDFRYEVYYLNKSGNDTIPVAFFSDNDIGPSARGASVKGNTYWFAKELNPKYIGEIADFLVCFDFKRERFGPRLKLPIHSYTEDCVTLYSVRDEQLAVLHQRFDTLFLEIWITNKIEPNEVSWNSKVFLAVDLDPPGIFFPCDGGSFFIDEEKKVAVVSDEDAYVIGEGGYVKKKDFRVTPSNYSQVPPVISYVPSLAQIKQPNCPGKRKKPDCPE